MAKDVKIFFVVACYLFYTSCYSIPTKPTKLGLVGIEYYFYEPAADSFVFAPTSWPGTKIWFKDSLIVEESIGIYSNTDTSGVEKRWTGVLGYFFIDLQTRSFYEFGSFSDTATLRRKYTQPDSVGIIGGWNFYYPRSIRVQSYQPLRDTIIEGIEYKRMNLLQSLRVNQSVSTIGYFRCDKKGTIFQFDKTFSDKIGCPLVRVDETLVQKGSLSRRINFLRNSLTPQEFKVFAAWEKFAKENPVLK